jgi:nucleotidyltransferase/DNA polymerase involved in DNA repair
VRIAFVSIPSFPCAVEVSRRPLLTRLPLIVGDAEQPRRVLDRSPEAAQRGVRPGMQIRKALGLCPDAAVLPPDPVLYRNVWQTALDAFWRLTPEVEDAEMGRAYLNATGLQAIYRDEAELADRILDTAYGATGLHASAGIANGKLPALVAASSVAPGETCIIAPGEERDFLAPHSVELLPVAPEVVERLQALGIEDLRDVARLTVPELQSQFGFLGRRLWELANGIDTDRLVPRPHTEALAGTFNFEAPVAGIDVMLAVAKQLLSRLQPSLNGRAARKLTLQGELTSGRGWEQELTLREAVSEEARLLFVLRSMISNFPPPQALRSLTLRLDDLAGESGKQLTLGERRHLQVQLEEAIGQLKSRYGYSPVYRCVDVEPWSVIPEERQILVESDA